MAGKEAQRRVAPPLLRPAAPTSSPGAPKLPGTTTSVTGSSKGRVKTWADYNNRVSDQERVIGVKNSDGRYVHPSCADQARILPPTSKPVPVTIVAYAVNRYASSGGLLCGKCNVYIVPPTSKKGVEKAQTDWEKANQAFLEGKITKEQWLAAVARFASSNPEQD